jgi:hypothetical protein
MNNRLRFLTAGGAQTALALCPPLNPDTPRAFSVYLHGMLCNR